MNDSTISSLADLTKIRSAPVLNKEQKQKLLNQLDSYITDADWFTVGIMASSSSQAIDVLRELEKFFNWSAMKIDKETQADGPVFLKANQKTGSVHIRIEYGLGEGVLLGCQYNDERKDADTFGPFPLNLFKANDISNNK